MGRFCGRLLPWVLLCGLGACSDRRPVEADGSVLAVPGTVDFARVGIHASPTKSIYLNNLGPAPMSVRSMSLEGADGQSYSAHFETGSLPHMLGGEKCRIDIQFAPSEERPLPATLVLRTDSRVSPVIRIPLTGVGVKAMATLGANLLDFGRIEAQSQEIKTLQLTNPSELTVQVGIAGQGPDSDEFDVPGSLSMAPFSQTTLEVRFHPNRVGKKDAKLMVTPCSGCGAVAVTLLAEALDRAVVAQPAAVDFGQVPVDQSSTQNARIHNLATVPMQVTGFSLGLPGDPSFGILPGFAPLTLQPDEIRDFKMSFNPTHMGSASGTAIFDVVSIRNPTTALTLTGFGGSAELCISPLSYDFGTVPVGARVPVVVTVRNCGASSAKPMTVSSIAMMNDGSPNQAEFNLGAVALPQTLAANQQFTTKVFFEPTAAGAAAATVAVQTSAYGGALIQLHFQGVAQVFPACQLRLNPSKVDFGTVRPSHGAVLGIKLTNEGKDICAVKNIHLSNDAGGVFKMPGGVIDGVLMYPGDFFAFQVSATVPSTPGAFQGAVDVRQANSQQPDLLVPLSVTSQDSCLVAVPPFLDFGLRLYQCSARAKQTVLTNQCGSAVELDNIQLGPGTSDTEFMLTQAPAPLPMTLAPGQSVTVGVGYQAQVAGQNMSPLFISVAGLTPPYLVPILGETSTQTQQTDAFTQSAPNELDVLFVVDNGLSMREEEPRLSAAIPSFIQAAQRQGLDLHVAVTSTGLVPVSNACPGGAQGGENGRFFPVDDSSPRLVTLATPNVTGILQNNVQVGACTDNETAMEAMRRALSAPLINEADDPSTPQANDGNAGFLRDEAALAVIFAGDEDDHSPDDVSNYVKFLRQLKGVNQPQRAAAYGIGPTQQVCFTQGGTGDRYQEITQLTGGSFLTNCAADYSPLLTGVVNKSYGPQSSFSLSQTPVPGSIAVTVNGSPQPSGWHYDGGSNSVVFDSAPPPASKISATYTRACGP